MNAAYAYMYIYVYICCIYVMKGSTRAHRRYAYLVTAGEDTRIFGEHSVAPVARRRSGDYALSTLRSTCEYPASTHTLARRRSGGEYSGSTVSTRTCMVVHRRPGDSHMVGGAPQLSRACVNEWDLSIYL